MHQKAQKGSRNYVAEKIIIGKYKHPGETQERDKAPQAATRTDLPRG